MISIDFVNLTNGLACCSPSEPHYLRVQSTWCEQKRWADVLATVGPDFLYHLATADTLRLHDVSEKPRVTRALWQGVPWVLYAARRTWGLEAERVVSRSGMDVTTYFSTVYSGLDDRLVRQVAYFAQFASDTTASVSVCDWPTRTATTYAGVAA